MEGVFVRLYHLSPNKELTQIFPNAGRTDNFVKGGETVTLPGPGDHFKFRIKAADKDGRPSLGTGIILAVASPVQFTDTENLRFAQGEVFKSFAETDLRKSLLRGVKGLEVEVTNAAGRIVGNRSAPTFSARVVFTVSEK